MGLWSRGRCSRCFFDRLDPTVVLLVGSFVLGRSCEWFISCEVCFVVGDNCSGEEITSLLTRLWGEDVKEC